MEVPELVPVIRDIESRPVHSKGGTNSRIDLTQHSVEPRWLAAPASCCGQIIMHDLDKFSGCFHAEDTTL